MSTINSAKALGKEKAIGSLEIGKKADIITIDLRSPHLVPIFNPYSHLVYCAHGSDVKDTIVNGKFLMKNRLVLTLDEDAVIKKAQEIATLIK
jgi:cytosine/adenosine deaminase-related metal-dependent hydrolase